MCMITNCEYLHCSLESTFLTHKNVLKGDFCSQWLIQIIHHSLVVVYTDSSEFPWWNCQMQFLSILAFIQLFRFDYSIFFSFLCLAHDMFWEIACNFFVPADGTKHLIHTVVTQCSQYPRGDCGSWPRVGSSAVPCSQPSWGHQGRTTAPRAQGTPQEILESTLIITPSTDPQISFQ